MKTYKHYVPVLRWKKAEWIAMQKLNADLLRHITPLIEIIPFHFTEKKKNEKNETELINEKILKAVKDLENIFKNNSFFIDTYLLSGEKYEHYVLEKLFKEANEKKIPLIPITSLIRDDQYNLKIKNIIKTYNCGLCLRIDIEHLKDNLELKIDKILSYFNLMPEQIDLIIDYKLILKENPDPKFIVLCQTIPYLKKWRSFTTLSGNFPKFASEYSVDTHHIPRFDWLMWKKQIAVNLLRIPSFGDYTIQHPIFNELPKGATPSASIRYTAENDWILLRGESLKKKGGTGHAQYPAHAQLLTEMQEFKDQNFSNGDLYIYEMSQKAGQGREVEHPGTPYTWLMAGINHHLTLVATQISNLNEI